MQAWNERGGKFDLYTEKEISLAAFFHCNGCGSDPKTDSGMLEKLDRLQRIGVSTVHVGICAVKERETMTLCSTIEKITELLSERGISVVVGTH